MSGIDLSLVLNVAIGIVLGVILLIFLGLTLKALVGIFVLVLGGFFLALISVLRVATDWYQAHAFLGPLAMSLSMAALGWLTVTLAYSPTTPVLLILTLTGLASIGYLMVALWNLGGVLRLRWRGYRAARGSAERVEGKHP